METLHQKEEFMKKLEKKILKKFLKYLLGDIHDKIPGGIVEDFFLIISKKKPWGSFCKNNFEDSLEKSLEEFLRKMSPEKQHKLLEECASHLFETFLEYLFEGISRVISGKIFGRVWKESLDEFMIKFREESLNMFERISLNNFYKNPWNKQWRKPWIRVDGILGSLLR